MSVKNWIWTKDQYDSDKPVTVFFRRSFTLDQVPAEPVFVQVTADTRYRFFVNGHFVCTGPRRGDDKQWFYERVNIRKYLNEGENVLAASVLRYPPVPYRGFRSAWRTQTPGFMLKSECEAVPSSDVSWKCRIAQEIETGCRDREYIRLFQEETVRGDLLLKLWNRTVFDDSDWNEPMTYPPFLLVPSVSPLFMKERTVPLMYEKEKHFTGVHHIVSSKIGKETYDEMLAGRGSVHIPAGSHEVIDILAEKLTTGYLQLSVCKGKNSKMTILESEAYAKMTEINGRPSMIKADRLDYTYGELMGPTDIFFPGGYGTEDDPEVYEPFAFREFRLIRLEIVTGDEELILKNFSYRETGYPLDVRTEIRTSDPSLTDIWRICENTLRACMHETYEDCPGYEQLQYVMDTRSQILFTYCSSGDDRLARQAIDDISRSQRADGLIAACYPSFKSNVIPVFSVYYVLMIYDHMMYYGDRKFLKHYWPSVMRVCSFFIDHIDETGMVGKIENMGGLDKCYWGYIDSTDEWVLGIPPVAEGKNITMMSLLTMTLLDASAKIADYIGYHDEAAEYTGINDAMRDTLRKTCISETGLVQDTPGEEMFSQVSQIFGVLNDVLTGEEAEKAMEKSLKGKMTPCSLPMVFYQLRALEKTGLYHLCDDIMERWRTMLKLNLSTTLEHDSPNQQRSDCHAWASIPMYEMTAVMLGIRPAEPGYASVSFNPVPGYLQWAEGDVITPKGMVHTSWKLENGEIVKSIILPEGLKTN